jgi:hypothetical protein
LWGSWAFMTDLALELGSVEYERRLADLTGR